MVVLVTGFGAFPGVERNPTEALAEALDGREGDGLRVVGRVLPVSYARGPAAAIEVAREVGAGLVVGLGVASSRSRVEVETLGRRVWGASPDVDGCVDAGLIGPDAVRATLDVEGLARALDAGLSEDAGTYVCNAWLYRVASALEVPVGFVHVPSSGIEPSRLWNGLVALAGGRGGRPTT